MAKDFGVCGEVSAGGVVRTMSALLTVASGASGAFISLTPPSGQRVRLTRLHSAGGANEAGVSIRVNGVAIVSGITLAEGNPNNVAGVGQVRIGSGYPTAPYIDGGTDEVIEVVKDVGITANDTEYAYQYLE